MSTRDERGAASDARRGGRPAALEDNGVRRYRAAELIGKGPWMVIEHGDAEYRLRITRLGKLILTK